MVLSLLELIYHILVNGDNSGYLAGQLIMEGKGT